MENILPRNRFKILTRMIKLSSHPGDIVLTPFAGAGTECVAAKMTGRHFIGFEIEEKYCKISEERLAHTVQENEQIHLFQITQEEEAEHDKNRLLSGAGSKRTQSERIKSFFS